MSDGRQRRKASVVFAHLKPQQTQIFPKRRRLWGYWLYVAARRLEDNDLLVVVTPNSPSTANTDYAARWGIETLFGIFTPGSFCLKSTHFTDSERSLPTLCSINPGAVLGISHRSMVARNQTPEIEKARTQSQEHIPRLVLTTYAESSSTWTRNLRSSAMP